MSELSEIQKKNKFNHDIARDEEDLVDVQVDGEWVKMPRGLNVVEVVKRVGKFLPHYCYHPKLTVVGNCRMCLFEMGMPKAGPDRKPILKEDGLPEEIMWSPRPAIGCATNINQGMGIRTDSPLAKECRKGVMEFLLINHPLDCPICDQAGECHLQEYSVDYGSEASRFVEEKVHKPKRNDIGERIVLDDERCIMCSRCIRFATEMTDDPVLGFTERGSHTTLTVHPGKRFDNEYSLNTVDICPVGALTSKDFRFKMRVWFLRETKSICTGCATGCNTLIGSREDIVYRQTPRENEAVNSHWMCDRGRLGFHYIHEGSHLIEPKVKIGDKQIRGTWEDVFAQMGNALAPFTSGEKQGQAAILASATLTNEELFLVSEIRSALGGDSVPADVVPRTWQGDDILKSEDKNPNTAGAELMGLNGKGESIAAIKDGIESGQIKALLVFHEDAVAAGIPASTLEKLDLLIVQDILPSLAAEKADFLLPGASFAEKRGSMVNGLQRLQRLNKAIRCPGQAMEDVDILLRLREAATGGNGLHSIEDVFKAMAEKVSAFSGLSLSKIGDLGVELK